MCYTHSHTGATDGHLHTRPTHGDAGSAHAGGFGHCLPNGYLSFGARTWEFKSDGTNSYRGEVSDEGTHTVIGNQIVFKGGYCRDQDGTYTWAYDGKVLSFKLIADQCFDRRTVVNGARWTKKP